MTRLKSTRVALVSSVVLMLLSCAMLLGTTYAWLIDNVSTSANRIIVGNLDIDLLMQKDGEYVSIADGSGDIFKEANGGKAIKWEPGLTRTVYLAAKNIGTLAVKYDITLTSTEGDLAKGLQYAITPVGKTTKKLSGNWETISDNADNTGFLNKKLIEIVKDGKLIPEIDEDTYYFAITVHMPDNANDSFQGDTVTLDLCVAATQLPHEEDSFGKNYDKNTRIGEDNTEQDNEEYYDSQIPDDMDVVTISSLNEFKAFVEAVNTDKPYKDISVANNEKVFVKLQTDLNLATYSEFAGIGDGEDNSFDGTFNGYDHVIRNYIAKDAEHCQPLFRTTKGADILNLTIENFSLDMNVKNASIHAILLGTIEKGDVLIDNVTIKKSVIAGKGTIGILVGYIIEGNLEITNCTIEDVEAVPLSDSTDVAALLGDGHTGTDTEDVTFKEEDNTTKNFTWE